jgi:hypothetical protein
MKTQTKMLVAGVLLSAATACQEKENEVKPSSPTAQTVVNPTVEPKPLKPGPEIHLIDDALWRRVPKK